MRIFLCFLFLATAHAAEPLRPWPTFYSSLGREREVSFRARYRTDFRSLSEVAALSEDQRALFARKEIEPTLKFLAGPLTRRGIGGPQRGMQVSVDWGSATLVGGRVFLSYDYRGTWILHRDLPGDFSLPVPLQARELKTPRWLSCTDQDPDHQTDWYYWYYWDPERLGCDHRPGRQYELVPMRAGAETLNQKKSFPEYERLKESTGRPNRLQLTFAFGYVEDSWHPDPERDEDAGVREYRAFLRKVRELPNLREEEIRADEYRSSLHPRLIIGRRFSGRRGGVDVVISVVVAAGVDQMQLFAKSFAHDHDAFFGWFGHSRVGAGFDAETFWRMVVAAPDYYSVTTNYQLVYWGGCNSYSYYTLPFFEFKAHVANGADPAGTKGLDIIANGLPSYFHLNAANAWVVLKHLLHWEKRASYQAIIDEIERSTGGIDVLAAVLGDEDNED